MPFLSGWVNLDIDFHDAQPGRRALRFTLRLNPSENLALILRYVFFFTHVRNMSEIKLHPLRRGRCKEGAERGPCLSPCPGGGCSLNSITATGRILKEPSMSAT